MTRITVLGSADVRRGHWGPLPESEFADTVTAQSAFVSLEGPSDYNAKDWPLGEAVALELDTLDE